MDSVLNLIEARWPSLARRLPATLTARPDGRLLWQGVTMVSPLQPERESRRLVEQAFPDGLPARVVLLGHGNGTLEKVLLEGGVRSLCILVPDTEYLAAALAVWQDTGLLADPRLELLAPGQSAVIGPDDALMEIPSVVRAFPGFCATRRVEMGRMRAADRRLRILVVEPLSGGSLPVAQQAARAFAGLGHTVKSVSFDGMQQAHDTLNSTMNRHLQGRKLLQGFEELLGQMVLLEAARFRPDFVFALAQSPVSARISEELRAMGARTAFWFVEDCDTMPYWKALHGHFDLFLTIQKGRFHKELAARPPARCATCRCARTLPRTIRNPLPMAPGPP
jgi:spore maturation protein CgeB